MVIVEDILKSFGDVKVLKGISLGIDKSEIVSIVGPSGAGKTTLLQIIGTISKPDAGKIMIDNTDVFSLNNKSLASFRNKNIGFVFQFHQLLPEFTALENICIPAFIAGVSKIKAENKAHELLEFLNLSNRSEHKPNELSGGEQQRVAVARALINRPSLILADEPSGNLDTQNKEELHKLFFSLRELYKPTIIIVTHDQDLARMSDRMINMRDGFIA